MQKKYIKYIIHTCIMVLCALLTLGATYKYKGEKKKNKNNIVKADGEVVNADLVLWYGDENLADYIDKCVDLYKEETGVNVKVSFVPTSEITDKITEGIADEKEVPDVYIMTSEHLGKAYLAGYTKETDFKEIFETKEDGYNTSVGIYNNDFCAIPLCFEEPVLLYNKDLLKEEPKTFNDILAFADTFDGEKYPQVSSILEWDVKELQYNYSFVGSYLSYGGVNGDDEEIIDVNNASVIRALDYYRSLKDIFSIDLNKVDYDKVLEKFATGQTIITIANTKDIGKIISGEIEGTTITKDNLGITRIPDMSLTLKSKTLSFTDVICVNPFGESFKNSKGEFTNDSNSKANDFAKFLSFKNASLIKDMTDYIPYYKVDDEVYYDQYLNSVSLPKLATSNGFYVSLEVALGKVWNGTSPNEVMDELYESLK